MTDTPDPPPLIDQIPSEELRPAFKESGHGAIASNDARIAELSRRYKAGESIFRDGEQYTPEPATRAIRSPAHGMESTGDLSWAEGQHLLRSHKPRQTGATPVPTILENEPTSARTLAGSDP